MIHPSIRLGPRERYHAVLPVNPVRSHKPPEAEAGGARRLRLGRERAGSVRGRKRVRHWAYSELLDSCWVCTVFFFFFWNVRTGSVRVRERESVRARYEYVNVSVSSRDERGEHTIALVIFFLTD